MFAVYLCGPTDCFLNAMFCDRDEAVAYGQERSKKCDGYYIKYWEFPDQIDKSDTGWAEMS